MRVTALLVLFLVGCGSPAQPEKEDTSSAPTAFDPASAEQTTQWIGREHLSIQSRIKPGNEHTQKSAEKDMATLLDGLRGKQFAWPLKVFRVTREGDVEPATVTWQAPTRGQTVREYTVRLLPALDTHGDGFPPAPGGDAWLTGRSRGDVVILSGVIEKVEHGDSLHIRKGEQVWTNSVTLRADATAAMPRN